MLALLFTTCGHWFRVLSPLYQHTMQERKVVKDRIGIFVGSLEIPFSQAQTLVTKLESDQTSQLSSTARN